MAKKIELPRLTEITTFCPKLQRNVRTKQINCEWDSEIKYGDHELSVKIHCKCGEIHKVRVACLCDPCAGCPGYDPP